MSERLRRALGNFNRAHHFDFGLVPLEEVAIELACAVETELANSDIVDLSERIIELSDGTSYVPVIHPTNKMVGYRCQHPDGRETFIYFNPSDHADPTSPDVPNVFVYEGPHFDPALDVPSHHYVIEWPDEAEEEPIT